MTHVEAIQSALKLCAGDERGVCQCKRCVTLRNMLRQINRKVIDKGATMTVKDGNLVAR
jgi:hypothetical protein